MRIYSLSKVLALPVMLAFIYLLVFEAGSYAAVAAYILVPTILLVVLWIFHGQIDHWYLERNPIKMDEKMRGWFQKYSAFYNSLNPDETLKYESRLMLYLHGREFKSVGTNELRDVPYDLQCILASQVTMIMLGLEDYLLGDLDRIYVYKHPFKTPDYQMFHNVETNVEDGILILNTEYAIPGVTNTDYFNITLYGYVCSFIEINPELDYPALDMLDWTSPCNVLGLERELIQKLIGLEEYNLTAIHIVAFFMQPDKYKELKPGLYDQFCSLFNQRPTLESYDVPQST